MPGASSLEQPATSRGSWTQTGQAHQEQRLSFIHSLRRLLRERDLTSGLRTNRTFSSGKLFLPLSFFFFFPLSSLCPHLQPGQPAWL